MRKKTVFTIAAATVAVVAAVVSILCFDSIMLRTLPYSGKVSGEIDGFAGLDGKPAIIAFGILREGFADLEFLDAADGLIEAYSPDSELGLLFFNIDPENTSLPYGDWKRASVYNGAPRQSKAILQIWAMAHGTGFEVTPVVFFVNKNGEAIAAEAGIWQKEAIASHISELLEYEIVPDLRSAAEEITVLADAFGKYGERKSRIIERREALLSGGDEIDALNFVRFLAGLPSDVEAAALLNAKAELGAELLTESGYGHTPPMPDGWDEEMYTIAYSATESGCIAYSRAYAQNELVSPADTVLFGWMGDEDAENIGRLGHRRWFLNPDLKYAGFGSVDKYKAYDGLYYRYLTALATDTSRNELVPYQAIAYPGGAAFPSEYFRGDFPWSVTLNPFLYDVPDESKVTVTLSGGGHTYKFSAAGSDGFFAVNTDTYGVNNCLIFRPDGIGAYYGEYSVSVSGIMTADGHEAKLAYTVSFF
jgi:hypothetical protein